MLILFMRAHVFPDIVVDGPNAVSSSDNFKIIVYVSNATSASEAMYNPIIKVYSHDESNVRILGSN